MKNQLLLFFCLPVFFLSCRKNDAPDPEPGIVSRSLEEFMVNHRSPMQKFTLDPSVAIHLTGPQGIVIDIPANSIKNGNTPVTGPVQITLAEAYSRKDMILHEMPTSTYTGLLNSQGEFYLSIMQNNQLLSAQGTVRIPASATSPNSSQLYWGLAGPGFNNAQPNAPVSAWAYMNKKFPLQQTGNNWFYELQMQFQGCWWNFDIPYPESISTSPISNGNWSSPVSTKPKLFLTLDGLNRSTAQLFPVNNTFVSGPIAIPDGMPGKVIGMQCENGKFYFGKTSVNTGPGIAPYVELKEISEANLVAELNAL